MTEIIETSDYKGPDRRQDTPRIRDNPGMILLVFFNVLIVAIVIFGQKTANDRYLTELEDQTIRAENGRQVVLFVCEELEDHRRNTRTAHDDIAAAHGIVLEEKKEKRPDDPCKPFRSTEDEDK